MSMRKFFSTKKTLKGAVLLGGVISLCLVLTSDVCIISARRFRSMATTNGGVSVLLPAKGDIIVLAEDDDMFTDTATTSKEKIVSSGSPVTVEKVDMEKRELVLKWTLEWWNGMNDSNRNEDEYRSTKSFSDPQYQFSSERGQGGYWKDETRTGGAAWVNSKAEGNDAGTNRNNSIGSMGGGASDIESIGGASDIEDTDIESMGGASNTNVYGVVPTIGDIESGKSSTCDLLTNSMRGSFDEIVCVEEEEEEECDICFGDLKDPITCSNDLHQFCKQCVVKWAITKAQKGPLLRRLRESPEKNAVVEEIDCPYCTTGGKLKTVLRESDLEEYSPLIGVNTSRSWSAHRRVKMFLACFVYLFFGLFFGYADEVNRSGYKKIVKLNEDKSAHWVAVYQSDPMPEDYLKKVPELAHYLQYWMIGVLPFLSIVFCVLYPELIRAVFANCCDRSNSNNAGALEETAGSANDEVANDPARLPGEATEGDAPAVVPTDGTIEGAMP